MMKTATLSTEGGDGSPATTVHDAADALARCAFHDHEEPSIPVGMLADAHHSIGMGEGDAELAGASVQVGMGGEGFPGQRRSALRCS